MSKKDKVLVIGLGEIGEPIYRILFNSRAFDVYKYDVKYSPILPNDGKVDVIHICIPCSNTKDFMRIVCDYVCEYEPKLLIIHSTVTPLTTKSIWSEIHRICPYVAHSPVRGVHTKMVEDLLTYKKFVGGVNEKSKRVAINHLIKAKFNCEPMGDSTTTELAKLFETSYAATIIAMYQEMHRISVSFGIDFADIIDMFIDTHKHRLDRPIYHPSVIGGHCLMPNIALLNTVTKSHLFRFVALSNELRENEVKDPIFKSTIKECKRKFDVMRKWTLKVLGRAGKE